MDPIESNPVSLAPETVLPSSEPAVVSESTSTLSFSSLWAKIWPPQEHKWIWIGIGIGVLIIILGIWWWRTRRTNKRREEPHDHDHDHDHEHDHQSTVGKEGRPINEKNFAIGKEKMVGTLGIMDKAIDNLKKTLEELEKETDPTQIEELKQEIKFHHEFLKKMNDQAIRFRGLLLEDAKTLNQYTAEFQSQVDNQVKQAGLKLQTGTQLLSSKRSPKPTTSTPPPPAPAPAPSASTESEEPHPSEESEKDA